MNGVHDMGGMQGFGPILPEPDEPPFHAAWERRALALTLAMGATGAWTLDHGRAARENLPPAQYLASSYYRIWFDALIAMMLARGLVTVEEVADGRLREPARSLPRQLRADAVAAALARGSPTLRPAAGAPRFHVGDAVRTCVMNPTTHTRLPRYCRGQPGTVTFVHGVHVFPDANARDAGDDPQWLYAVRFDARTLWGTDTTASEVRVDCWESHLTAG